MVNNQEEKKGNKVLAILMKEYPAERILMGVLGIIVIILGVYLIQGDILTIQNSTDWWNSWVFGSDTGILIFSIFIVVVGVVSFFVAIFSIIRRIALAISPA